MPWIANATTQQLAERIRESNRVAATKTTRYPKWEDRAIRECYMFCSCPCDEKCFCRKYGCTGHWVINGDLTFRKFLGHYVYLWTPFHDSLENAVLYGDSPHPRNKAAVSFLRHLSKTWNEKIRECEKYTKSLICDLPLDADFRRFVETAKHLYHSKAVSQIFYDYVVPYDGGSRQELIRLGYGDPTLSLMNTNDRLAKDIRTFIERNGLTIPQFRQLDNPREYFPEIPTRATGQPFSRIIDKIFYRP